VSPLVPTDRTTDARDQGDESTIRPSGGAGTVWRSPICRSRIHRGIRPVRCLLWTIDDAGERRQARQPGAPSRASIPSGSNTPGVRRAGCRTCGRYRRTLPRTVGRSPGGPWRLGRGCHSPSPASTDGADRLHQA